MDLFTLMAISLTLVVLLHGQGYSAIESETIKQLIERRNCLFGFRFKNDQTQPYVKISNTRVSPCDTSQPMPPCFVGNLLIVNCDFCTSNISVTLFNPSVTNSSSAHICMTYESEDITAAVPTHGGPVVSNDSILLIVAIVVLPIIAIIITCCCCGVGRIVYSRYCKGRICTKKLEAVITTEPQEEVKDDLTDSALIVGKNETPGIKQSSRDSHANKSFAREDDTLKKNKKQDTPPVVPEVSNVNIQEDESLANLSREETPPREE